MGATLLISPFTDEKTEALGDEVANLKMAQLVSGRPGIRQPESSFEISKKIWKQYKIILAVC